MLRTEIPRVRWLSRWITFPLLLSSMLFSGVRFFWMSFFFQGFLHFLGINSQLIMMTKWDRGIHMPG